MQKFCIISEKLDFNREYTTQSICIFIDMNKAFDTVSHKDLLETLGNIGFSGKALDLMRSYVNNKL